MQGDLRLNALAQASGNAQTAAKASRVLRSVLAGRSPGENDRAILRREAELLELMHGSISAEPTPVRAQLLGSEAGWTFRNLRDLASLLEARKTIGPLEEALPKAISELRELADPTKTVAKDIAQHAALVCREILVTALSLLGSARHETPQPQPRQS